MRNCHTGWVLPPLTSILDIMLTPTPLKSNLSSTNFLISASLPGSCHPNWLHGKHTIWERWGKGADRVSLGSSWNC